MPIPADTEREVRRGRSEQQGRHRQSPPLHNCSQFGVAIEPKLQCHKRRKATMFEATVLTTEVIVEMRGFLFSTAVHYSSSANRERSHQL